MNYLAIDTSGDLTVLLKVGDKKQTRYLKGCNTKHSLTLMPYIEEVLQDLSVNLNDLDFIACVTGPGSFTGIRIGISTVKALCFACNKPVLSLTSFDLLAYADNAPSKSLCIINANHGNYYCAAYNDKNLVLQPCFLTEDQIVNKTEEFGEIVVNEAIAWHNCVLADQLNGLERAIEKNLNKLICANQLLPLYVKRSQAEEQL
ncbi:MAG: tRNA (adenosine(37)-N6)-threonylcarbamoyltransferase complex dimerization subunit type 1 TsaB [Clostridia bacterium]|nr:tRNA (adenosine(37)-N6)-threonylcarbamoyltransferase complex dimerization subunit type 1 TsaB [Clostridia bacterium]